MFQRILIPLDGSQRAERAVLVAGCVAQVTGGSLLLLQVLSAPAELLPFVAPALEPSTLSADESAAMNYLKSVALLAPDVQSELVVRTGLAANMIANVADTEHVDAIFLTSDGPAGLFRRLLGGIPERVSHTSPAPVLVQRGVIPSPVGCGASRRTGAAQLPARARAGRRLAGRRGGVGACGHPRRGALVAGSKARCRWFRFSARRRARKSEQRSKHISRARSSDCARRRSTRSTSPPTGPSQRVKIRLRRWRGSPPRPTPARARSTSSPSRLHLRSAPSAGPSTM